MSAMPAVLRPIDLDRHEKVRAWVDLPGVPIGTPGKVLQVGGLTWIRYRVLFENGVDHGLLDGRHVVAARTSCRSTSGSRSRRSPPSRPAATTAAAGRRRRRARDNEFGVPAHLLERAKAARARRAAL